MAIVDLKAVPRGRRWAVLAPYLQKAEYDALLVGNNFQLWNRETAEEAWNRALGAVPLAGSYVNPVISPLPGYLAPKADELKTREVFQREYARKADVKVGMVPLASLLPPQPIADLDYVDELRNGLEQRTDDRGDFDFAFPTGNLSEPMVVGPMVIFNAQTNNVFVNPVPTLARAGDEIHITFRASVRPNYVFVGAVAGRLVLLNGVHKVLAALAAGRTELPAVIRTATSVPELGLPPSSLFAQFGNSRPPLVSDFMQGMAIQLERKGTRTLTRLVTQIDQIMFPDM